MLVELGAAAAPLRADLAEPGMPLALDVTTEHPRILDSARRLALILRGEPCGALPQTSLNARCGLDDDYKRALFCAYRRGWVDFCRDYVVITPRMAAKR